MKPNQLGLIISLWLSLAGSLFAETENPHTDWFRMAKYGVFMHFLPSGENGLQQVRQFDVPALARQLEDMGAGYFVLTLGQNSGYFNSPNAAYEKQTGYAAGERCSVRDLPLELYAALHARKIRLMLYLPCQVPNQDSRAQKAYGLAQGPQDQPIDLAFADKWSEVIQEWSDRYGDKVAGWWFDGGYAQVGFNEAIAKRYAAAVKHGNSQAIVTFNPGVQVIRWTQAEDYTAGELNEPFETIPTTRWLKGSQWHALTYLGSSWGQRNTRYPEAQWVNWIRKVAAGQGVVTFDLGPNYEAKAGPVGQLAEAQVQQIKAIRSALKPAPAGAEAGWKKTQFQEVDTLFANPGQGWMSQKRSPKGNPRFPCSVVYLRFDWAQAEPVEGQYNWKFIDDTLAAWKSSGAAVAIRIMTANAHSDGYYSSPKWLFDAGCKGVEYHVGGGDPTSGGKGIPRIEPDYADPIYLAKHGAFLEALGKRYDGTAGLEFLDIGSYGIWGEWHTEHPAPVAVRKQIVDLYLRAFPKTPLVFMSDDFEVMPYALAHGTGVRRDGVGSPWHEQNWIGSRRYAGVPALAEAWKQAPVVFEWFGDYDYLKSKHWSFDAAVNFMLANHVSLINDNIGKVPPELLPQLEKLARLAGYRFVLRELAHPESIHPGQVLKTKMKWANVGVGKLYHPYELQLSLRNANGQSVLTINSPADPREWSPGDTEIETALPLPPKLEKGKYVLSVALVDPEKQHPPLKLAMDAPAENGWYVLSTVKVE